MIAAVSVATASPVQVEAASFLTDVPATLLLVIATALTWRFLADDEARPNSL